MEIVFRSIGLKIEKLFIIASKRTSSKASEMSDVNKKLSTEFANKFSALVSHTAAMRPAAAVLALNPGDLLVGAVAVLPTSFLDRWHDHSVAGVAQFTGAIWQVTLCRSEIVLQ